MKPATEQDYRERVVRAVLYIQQHLDDELSLDRIAAITRFPDFIFTASFTVWTGETLNEYVRRLRLERAAGQLKYLDQPITDIALRAGFDAHESFTRAFGDMFGMSPSAYRAASLPMLDHGNLLTVEVKEHTPLTLVMLRHTGPYNRIAGTWDKLMSWAAQRGVLGVDAELVGIAHDDPDITHPDRIRYDAAVVVREPVRVGGEFSRMELAGGLYATTHRGPYSELPSTYQRLYGGCLPRSGFEPREVYTFEEYLNSPQDRRPEDLITRIHLPTE